MIMGLFSHKSDTPSVPYQDSPANKSSKKRLIIIIIISILLLLLVGGGLYYYSYKTNPSALSKITGKTISDESDADEMTRIVKEVKEIMLLPDETPIFATVTDLQKVKDQTFFVNAALGDKVLIFMQAKKAILYRPSQRLIVEVGTVNNPDSTGTINGENITVNEPTPIPETTNFLPETTPTNAPSPTVTQRISPTPTIPLSSEF